jgi:Derlin-2/3
MPVPRVRDGNDLGGPEEWYSSLPIITKNWLTATFVITCLTNFEAISIRTVIWDFSLLKDEFQIWRLASPFFYVGGFSFNTAISLFLLYQYSKQYEAGGVYNTGAGGGTADYAFMLMFGVAMTIASTFVIGLSPIFCQNLVYYVLYVWSKRHPTADTSLWGFPMKAPMLPFAILGLTVLMGNPWIQMVHGFVMGHLYYFLVEVVPIVYGKDYIHTPMFLINMFGVGEYVEYIPPTPASVQVGAGAGGRMRPLGAVGSGSAGGSSSTSGYNWGGGGRSLGRE